MNEEFGRINCEVRSKFDPNRGVWLSVGDLERMAKNGVVLAPADRDPQHPKFYESILLCKVCEFRSATLEDIASHCNTRWHQKQLILQRAKSRIIFSGQTSYIPLTPVETPPGMGTCENVENQPYEYATPAEEDHISDSPNFADELSIADKVVLESIKSRSDGLSYSMVHENLLSCQYVRNHNCELCQMSVIDLESFLLHFTGFGHQGRKNRLLEHEADYFQAFRDPRTGSMYYLNHRFNTLHDRLPLTNDLMFGYTSVSKVSMVSQSILDRFIDLTQM
jgi:hypothetical protein